MATLDDVARLATALPDVVIVTVRHGRAWSVGGTKIAWERPFTKADLKRFGDETPPSGPIVAVRVEDLGEKEAVLAAGHAGVFTTPHFDGYAAVQVALDAVDDDVLAELLEDAWLSAAPSALADEYLRGGDVDAGAS